MSATQPAIHRRSQLLSRLEEARTRTDELFATVRPDSLYERPIRERHRIIFYLGHMEAFDWNLLRERLLGQKDFHPEFDQLFAFGIDPVEPGGLPSDQPSDWPSIGEVREYGRRIRENVDRGTEAVLDSGSEFSAAAGEFSANVLLNTAIEHRLMHAETLAYMLHQLPFSGKVRPARRAEAVAQPVDPKMIEIPAGTATLGLRRDPRVFGWDNEYEEHQVFVPAFAIDQFKVTNGQYLEFVEAGGYEDRDLWSDADWNWRTENNIAHPAFWRQRGGEWFCVTMFDEIPLPAEWPVYVSQAEASAYARWAGKSLPTEAQWHRAAYGTPEGAERIYPWGAELPSASRGNFDFQRWDPAPLNSFPQGSSAFGVADLLGNGWEWTSSLFEPFAGFHAFSFYPGYSANFFDGKHYVLKGGSARTAACMLRRSFRNWFQPHYQYVYAAFRCVSH
jgi:ergothioneine biosynthesis protein EgtB